MSTSMHINQSIIFKTAIFQFCQYSIPPPHRPLHSPLDRFLNYVYAALAKRNFYWMKIWKTSDKLCIDTNVIISIVWFGGYRTSIENYFVFIYFVTIFQTSYGEWFWNSDNERKNKSCALVQTQFLPCSTNILYCRFAWIV